MPVSAVNPAAAQATASSSSAISLKSLNYDAFLQLLVSEMKNQDPTEPTDTSEYMAQLASFASVEQEIQTNARLDKILSSLSMTQATGAIGKTVTSADGSVSGVVTSVKFFSDSVKAILQDGTEITIGPGVTVSQT